MHYRKNKHLCVFFCTNVSVYWHGKVLHWKKEDGKRRLRFYEGASCIHIHYFPHTFPGNKLGILVEK